MNTCRTHPENFQWLRNVNRAIGVREVRFNFEIEEDYGTLSIEMCQARCRHRLIRL